MPISWGNGGDGPAWEAQAWARSHPLLNFPYSLKSPSSECGFSQQPTSPGLLVPAVPWSVSAVPKPLAPTGRAGPSAELMGSFWISSLLGDVEVEDSL